MFVDTFKKTIMKRNLNNVRLTKDFILSKISQVSIFSYYSGLDVDIIQECIDKGTLISSPFRIDEHPSFGFRYDNRGKLKGKDFAGYFHGDCFDAAAYVISEAINKSIDINNKQWFIFILKHIAYSFRNIIYGKEKDINLDNQITNALIKVRNKKPIIEFVIRDWNKYDIEYWSKFGVIINYLNTNFIYPVDQYYINRKINPEPKYYYDKDYKDLCYAYVLGQDSNGIYNIKLYFPNRPKGVVRFITNSNCLEGLLNLERDDYELIIITKSTKDRLSIKCYLDRVNIDSSLYGGTPLIDINKIGIVNLPHETYKLNQNEYNYLRAKTTGQIISLMDNDMTGYKEAIWLRDNFNIIPICIPKDLEVKDFAELVNKYSIETINELVINTNQYILDSYVEKDKFIWNTGKSNALPY